MTRVRLDTRLKGEERRNITWKVFEMLQNRRSMLHTGWDDEPYEFYLKLFPIEIRNACQTIATVNDGKFQNIVNTDTDAVVKLTVDGDEERVKIKWGRKLPCIPSGWGEETGITIKEAHPAWLPLANFVREWNEFMAVETAVSSLVAHVTDNCNTFGQIHRVWPDLLPTIGGAKVDAAERQKRKSSLPYMLDVDRIMKHRDQFTFLLAQGALIQPRALTTEVLD